ncbi:molybdopterin-guanine dinucleotide biosynthesis protein A [Arsukibacterium sp. MJ3]|uniref:molybdenum cofactor guanylyltransferase n=1 Tax=Arsukibacterium sp. MJ3 TaxID=1632859 RepID=UPI0006271E05|nr:molybdenum cofactor guanylyltransferase [Arsukibacterium sp. MJ3]KKO49800.1 molybdopterin-guanine dinucleotide biosynthesis protein A [Arsukibacterium sp. MJ3]
MASTALFSVLILAGGKSSRMGSDKAELQLNGQSLLAHMQQLALNTGASEVLISRNQPGFIEDDVKHCGPLAGILASLKHCHSEHVLILPIDTPLLNVASLQQLLQSTLRDNSCAAYFNNSPLPCVLAVTPALSTLIRVQLQTGQRSVHALLFKLNASILPAPADVLINTNTPEDWQRCLSIANTQLKEPLCQSLI